MKVLCLICVKLTHEMSSSRVVKDTAAQRGREAARQFRVLSRRNVPNYSFEKDFLLP